jgi:thiol-disulfide isomerase/thioredoxin
MQLLSFFCGGIMKKYYSYLLIAFLLSGVVLLNLSLSRDDNAGINGAGDFPDGVKVISFSSPHCGACEGFKREVEKVRNELEGDAVFESIDVTEDIQTADYYRIAVVPTILITYQGIEVDRFTGSKTAKELSAAIKKEIGFPKYCEDGTTC